MTLFNEFIDRDGLLTCQNLRKRIIINCLPGTPLSAVEPSADQIDFGMLGDAYAFL